LARRQDEVAALKTYRIFLVFLFCNIHTQTGYYKKGIGHQVAFFPAAIRPNVIKIGQHLCEYSQK